MWLITNFGFFSVVRKSGEAQLTVRSRSRRDLERLRHKYLPQLGEIVEGEGTDYRFRARVSREELGEAMKKIPLDIDYSNFKSSVAREQGHGRAQIYHDVWASLRRISEKE